MMKRVFIILLILILTLVFLLIILNKNNSYLVYIENDSDNYIVSGTGITYKYDDSKYYIVTNYHIVYNTDNVKVLNSSGKQSTGNVVYYDEVKDIAILTVEDIKLDIVDTYSCNYKKEDAVTINGLYKESIIKKTGKVIDERESINIKNDFGISSYQAIKIDSNIDYGDSGSAVIDSQGNLIGIMSVMNLTNNNSYAIPFCDIIDALQ